MGNRRMARRMARRAKLDEEGVAVSFGFVSLWAAVIVSILSELPYVGLATTLLTFPLHRIVLVTDQRVYVFRDRPFHIPGEVLGAYPASPGSVTRVRGKLTFADGRVVWHSPLFTWRARRIEEAVDQGHGSAADASAAG